MQYHFSSYQGVLDFYCKLEVLHMQNWASKTVNSLSFCPTWNILLLRKIQTWSHLVTPSQKCWKWYWRFSLRHNYQCLITICAPLLIFNSHYLIPCHLRHRARKAEDAAGNINPLWVKFGGFFLLISGLHEGKQLCELAALKHGEEYGQTGGRVGRKAASENTPFYNVSSGHVKPQGNSCGSSFPTRPGRGKTLATPQDKPEILSLSIITLTHFYTHVHYVYLTLFLICIINSTTYICLIHHTCQAVTRQIFVFLPWILFHRRGKYLKSQEHLHKTLTHGSHKYWTPNQLKEPHCNSSIWVYLFGADVNEWEVTAKFNPGH